MIHDGFRAFVARGSHSAPSGTTERRTLLTMGLQLTQFPRKIDANSKAAGSVEVKAFNKKVCVTADSSY